MTTVEKLRTDTIARLYGKTWWGTDRFYSDLSGPEQSTVTDEMAKYIAANPHEFSAGTEAAAKRWNTSGVVGLPYADNSLTAAAGTFVDEVGNQAKIINPLSEKNRTTTYTFLVIAAALYLLGPALIKAFSSREKG